MFCQNCGEQLRDGAKFCESCGTPVMQAKQPEPAQAEPEVGSVWGAPPAAPQAPSFSAEPNPNASGAAGASYSAAASASYAVPGPKGRAITGCGISLALKRYLLVNYLEFDGRASRSEYWWIALAVFVLNLLVQMLFKKLPNIQSGIQLIISLGLLLPNLSLFVRREHDIGRKWTRILVGLIPLVGAIMLLVDACKPGDETANQYGAAPIDASELTE